MLDDNLDLINVSKENIICDVNGKYIGNGIYLDMEKPCGKQYRAGELFHCTVNESCHCDYYCELHFSKLKELERRLRL